jgi:hypothetical protein
VLGKNNICSKEEIKVCHFEALVSRIEKLLSNESIQNVNVVLCCP